MLKKSFFLFGTTAMLVSCAGGGAEQLASPDGNVQLSFELSKDGTPTYSVKFDDEEIIKPSTLGFILKDAAPMTSGFKVEKITRESGDETWAPVWGENDSIRDHYNGMTVQLTQQAGDTLRKLDIQFRVYDDGAAFRYIFPDQETKTFVIADELSQMAMGGDYTAWWIPGDYDTQEYEYTKSKLSEISSYAEKGKIENVSQTGFSPTGVQTSLMLKTPSGKYVNLHEAALVDYPAMHLNLDESNLTFTSWLTPSPDGTKATIDVPFKTPWRVVMLGEKATDILATNIIYNLNEPNALEIPHGYIPPNTWAYGGR